MSAKLDAERILDDAMRLDPEGRAFVAETLIESLDLDSEFVISKEWLDEIHRRCTEIDSGQAKLLDGTNVINELREKYSR